MKQTAGYDGQAHFGLILPLHFGTAVLILLLNERFFLFILLLKQVLIIAVDDEQFFFKTFSCLSGPVVVQLA